jgi:hypothetical protein
MPTAPCDDSTGNGPSWLGEVTACQLRHPPAPRVR